MPGMRGIVPVLNMGYYSWAFGCNIRAHTYHMFLLIMTAWLRMGAALPHESDSAIWTSSVFEII